MSHTFCCTTFVLNEHFLKLVSFFFLLTADMHSLLDVVKIADSLIFVLDSTEGWDSYGEYCLSCLFAQGLPSHGGCLYLNHLELSYSTIRTHS